MPCRIVVAVDSAYPQLCNDDSDESLIYISKSDNCILRMLPKL
jgi:hypothetical protein